LQVEDLTISYFRGGQRHDAVRDVNLRIEPGQTYGLVGESGSGKSTLAMAAMRYLPGNGVVSGGAIRFAGTDLLALDDAQLAAVRGSRLNLVPQDPLSSLNPSQQIGPQLVEALALHGERGQEARPPRQPRRSGRARRARRQPAKGATLKLAARRLLEEVGIADGERVAQSYPHQLSGGMQQRVMMAMALSTEPELLVLDEPTTGLDVTTEAVVLDLVADLIRRHGTSALYITHDLGVVAGIADRVAVLYAGELVEDAAAAEFFQRPLHPYTRGLIDSVPRLGQHKSDAALTSMQGQIPPASAMPAGCVFAPRCPLAEQRCHDQRPPVEQAGTAHSIRCHRWGEIAAGTVAAGDYGVPEQRPVAADVGTSPPRRRMQIDQLSVTFRVPRRLAELLGRVPRRQVRAVDAVNLAIAPGQTLGIVGESGSGKSTIANAILGMVEVASGEIRLGDELLPPGLRQRTRAQLSALQLVAQNPYEALNPYMSVGASLRRPFRRLRGMSAAAAAAAVGRLLEEVGLYRDYAGRLPAELSGGERQRVAIARAIAADTVVALCDEPTSALDVSVQARIIELLSRLQRERKTSYVFISHDLSVVAYLADWIAVAYLGRIVEVGPRGSFLDPPHHPYTEALLSAVSSVDSARAEDAIRLSGDVPSPTAKPLGCPFHTRCPRYLGQLCAAEVPPLQISEDGHQVACHIPLDELRSIQAQRTGA
jgi:peptide/nickel transport system ATP-binding protein